MPTKKSSKKFYITTPIYYPNDIPHLGHAYTTISADVLARWHRLLGDKVLFLTGTDEHGKKIQQAAEKQGRKPKEFVDAMVAEFMKPWKALDISYDRFIRTTDKDHEKVVQFLLEEVNRKGDIYLDVYEGWYCTACEAYYTEKDAPELKCPVHGKNLEQLEEASYFFKLSKYQKKLLELYEKHPEFIRPEFRRHEIVNRVKEGLQDLSISRTSFSWGILLPFDKKHITYVWFDALTNYYTATREKGKEDFWPADVHIVGKDILWFHAVIWPAMLMSAGIALPKKIFAHGWLTVHGDKIGKSAGNAISVEKLISYAGVDAARYFLLRECAFGQDSDFSGELLVERYNSELANKLGNLVSRVSALCEKYGMEKFKLIDKVDEKNLIEILNRIKISDKAQTMGNISKSKVSKNKITGTIGVSTFKPGEVTIQDIIKASEIKNGKVKLSFLSKIIQKIVEKHLDALEFDKALNEIFAFIDLCNEYLQSQKPWETHDKKVLYEAANAIKEIAILLSPFMPDSCEKIGKVFGFSLDWKTLEKPLVITKVKKAPVLFVKVEKK